MTNAATPVLIVGAGPTGLLLALWLARLGVRPRIVDRNANAGTTSRALVVHPRTLEYYRQLGIADRAIARGLPFAAVNLWVHGERKAHLDLAGIGAGLSPFPTMLILAQDAHEAFLVEELQRVGVAVERGTGLTGFTARADGITAQLRGPQGESACECRWLAGCDGAHSKVRETLALGFPGGTYEHLFYVADIHGGGRAVNGELHVALDESDFLAVFPLPGEGNARLVGTVKEASEERRQQLGWDDVSRPILEHMRLDVARVNWFSTYRVHHRVVEHFRAGRAFLLGDAAHIHSPVGGQGMNTGLGDASNLAWKLAAVIGGRAPEDLLDSYEPERIAFARTLVATTDRAFTFVTRDGPLARFMRLGVVPAALPAAMSFEAVRRMMFRRLSQIEVEYRASPLSAGHEGAVHGGDRLPWVPDDFAPLASLDWQVHVHGEASGDLVDACVAASLPLHCFAWTDAAGEAGLHRDAAYLVRPDGYVALATAGAGSGPALSAYWNDHGFRTRTLCPT